MPSAKEFVQVLSKGEGLKSARVSMSSNTVKPFELSARAFLDFAFEESKTDSVRGKVCALSNVKRAIDCRIEELLYCYCLQRKSKHDNWNFPKKLEILAEIGILAPRILRKISTLRNRLEHYFEKPGFDRVEDACDIGQLFIEATEKLCYPFIYLEKEGCRIEFVYYAYVVKWHEDSLEYTLRIGAEDDWIRIAKLLVAKQKEVMRHSVPI